MTAIAWDRALLAAAARFAPDPAVALRLAGLDGWPAVADYDVLLGSARLAAVCPGLTFVPSPPRPRRRRAAEVAPGPGYDASIEAGRVPTRVRSWHDLFNGMIWSALPATKRAIHRFQREKIEERRAREPAGGARSREEDAVAMLDEGGMLLARLPGAGEALDRALARGDGEAVAALALAGEVRPVVVGHALLEHLARGQVGVRGFPLAVEAPSLGDLASIDEATVAMVHRVGPPGERPGVPVPAQFFAAAG